MTFLDIVTLLLFFLIVVGVWTLWFEDLNQQDKQRNKDSQCPQHDWEPTYADDKDTPSGYKFAGLRCTKCGRRPNGLKNGESWANGPLTPP